MFITCIYTIHVFIQYMYLCNTCIYTIRVFIQNMYLYNTCIYTIDVYIQFSVRVMIYL